MKQLIIQIEAHTQNRRLVFDGPGLSLSHSSAGSTVGGSSSSSSTGRYSSIGGSSGLSSGSSSSSSSIKIRAAFWHVSPEQVAHITEHFRPAFRQVQPLLHPFLHLQERSFRSSGGAGSCRLVMGMSPAELNSQPQSVTSFSSPNHFCTWWYVR